MKLKMSKREIALRKEFDAVEKQEKKLRDAALKPKKQNWKNNIESKIPAKVYSGLESAFCKAFSLVFSQGRAIIEKSFDKNNIQAEQAIRDYAVQVKGGRKEYKRIHKSAGQSSTFNMAITTVEGLALGALGIGVPDILLFISTLLKGVYQTALNYGFDYTSRQEQYLILKMMQAALSSGEEWPKLDAEVDGLFCLCDEEMSDEQFNVQLKNTASCFAVDMLLLKFVQGLPILGLIGGAANPIYYKRIIRYVALKYRKHYLMRLMDK